MNLENQVPTDLSRIPLKRRLATWIPWSIAILLGLVFAAFLLAPAFITCRPAHLTEATNNLRNLGIFLFAYEDEFGGYPSPENAPKLAEARGITIGSTTTSNDLLRLLLQGGFTNSEEVFYCKHPHLPPDKPDNVISPPSSILEPGECGFSYVTGLSTTDPGNTPLLLAPMVPGTTDFDHKSLDGNAIILQIDQSVRSYKINKSGRVILPNGLDIFDPAQPFWNGKSPDLRHPAR